MSEIYTVIFGEDELDIYEGDDLLHEIGCLDQHEGEILRKLVQGICDKMNVAHLEVSPNDASIGKSLFAFLRSLDGQLTFGEIMMLVEKTAELVGA
jgi:hypothetical protein